MKTFRHSLLHGICVPALLVSALLLSASAADVGLYAVYKRQVYRQADAGAPALESLPCVGSDALAALVAPATSDSVGAAFLVPGTGSPAPLLRWHQKEFLPRRWVFAMSAAFPNQAALNHALPNGEFAFSLATANDGSKTLPLKLAGDAYPPVPQIANWAAAQAVEAAKDFTLQWKAYAGGRTEDFIFVSVKRQSDGEPVFSTPFLVVPGQLDGKATSVTIPAGTLRPGETYDAYVRFDHILVRDTTRYPGAVGSASYARGTHFVLKTVLTEVAVLTDPPPPPPAQPVLISIFAPDPIAAEGTNCAAWPFILPPVLTNFWSGWTNFTGSNTATFVVMRSEVTSNDLTVAYSIGGTATNGVDYEALPGVVTIPAGRRAARIRLTPLPEVAPGARRIETVVLGLLAPTNQPPTYELARLSRAAAIIVGKAEPCPRTWWYGDGGFHCEIPATNGFWFRVETSSNLLNWSAVTTNLANRNAVHFVDPEADRSGQRYYRAVPVLVSPQWPE